MLEPTPSASESAFTDALLGDIVAVSLVYASVCSATDYPSSLWC